MTCPRNYRAFSRLVLCSNILQKVDVPFQVGDTPVLLIGRGERAEDPPRVWLSVPDPDSEAEFKHVVVGQRSYCAVVAVRAVPGKPVVEVYLGEDLLVRATARSEHEAVVEKLNLRPLGLPIEGTSVGLLIENQSFVANTFTGVKVAFALFDERSGSSRSATG